MKLISYSLLGKAAFGSVDKDTIIPLSGRLGHEVTSLRTLIQHCSLDQVTAAIKAVTERIALTSIQYLPVIPDPSKIFCIGLNYDSHRIETGREKTGYPTIFLRVADSQVGHNGALVKPRESEKLDYEGEIAVIIGKGGRDIAEANAYDHVFGYSCYNDASVRDWQFHTPQWAPGKNFESTGAFGPWIVTPDELGPIDQLKLETRLNGETLQSARVEEMIFSIPEQIAYLSTVISLRPGDVIVTGTPGGVGTKRNPPLYMKPGDVCEVEVSGIGILSNPIVAQS